MQLTIDLPDNLAASLNANRENLDRILEAGLRDYSADVSAGYHSLAEVLRFLASLPSPQEILDLRPSTELSDRISNFLVKNRENRLTNEDEKFWESYEFVEHIVRIAKKAALAKVER